jgi:RNA polymerase sigma-70 factor (ECF subfamily)
MNWLSRLRGRSSASAAAREFEGLMRQHIPALYRSAYRWTGSVERAEDLVQELLVRLFPLLEDLRKLEQVRPWAMRVMYRIFVDQLRREQSSPVLFGRFQTPGTDEDDEDGLIDPSSDPELFAHREFLKERILEAWAQLPMEHRVVLSMHDVEGYTVTDISSMTDIAVGTVKSRLHRARAKLRELLAGRVPRGVHRFEDDESHGRRRP